MTSKLNLLTAFLILAIIIIQECQASSSTTINSRYTNNNFANPTSNNDFSINNNNELDKYGIVNEVSIVKSPSSTSTSNGKNGDDKEYVTSFYKRVRNKHRCNLFGKVLEECSSNHGSVGGGLGSGVSSGLGKSVKSGVGRSVSSGVGRSVSGMDEQQQSVQYHHSLDHYFDHELRRTSSSIPSSSSTTQDASRAAHGYGQQQHKCTHSSAVEFTPYSSSSSSSSRAQAVRGGGGATRSMVQKPSTFVSKVHNANDYELDELDCHGDTRSRSETIWAPPGSSGYKNHRQRNVHSRRSMDHSVDFDTDEYDSSSNLEDDIQDILDGVVPDGEVHSTASAVDGLDEHHHLGLLRVPCSIAVNSGEATQYASSHAKTSMATYVDTGAQVTIISASAAKRAGIYHLMDRRYAGRATGVGQCRILGRIPARHVYFLLGGCQGEEGVVQDYDEEQEFDDGYPRGGDQDDYDSNSRVQMDGPALTVLEGTVTQGVDILLGLDVLQDWDAEIRMGKQKSITVHKRGSIGVVIPFASSSIDLQRRRHRSSDTRSSHSRPTHRRREYYPEDQDDHILTSSASDIESDLDLLDQSGHEFPEDIYISSRSSRNIDELLIDASSDATGSDIEDDENDDYLQYVDDEKEDVEIDMAGL